MFNFFKKQKIVGQKPVETISKSLLDEYLGAKKDIQYLEDKYDDYILRSLTFEFDMYKQYLDSNYPTMDALKGFWMINNIEYNKFILTKNDSSGLITINVSYEFYQDEFKLEYLYAYVHGDSDVHGNSVSLDKKKFLDVIMGYFMYYKLKEIKASRENKKASFQKMVDIVGKDIKRDSIIDKILS